MKHETTGNRQIQSLRRAAEILDLFTNGSRWLGISDIARFLQINKTTVQGLVSTLASLQYLEQDPDTKKYGLGRALFQLGMTYATGMDLVDLARVWMERLYYRYRIPVNVGMLVGGQVIIVLRVDEESQFMSFPRVGSVIPAHSTAIGKILLAHLEKKKQGELLKTMELPALTDNTTTSTGELLLELNRITEEGIAWDREENISGLAGMGAPLYDHTGSVMAAFAVTGNADELYSRSDELKTEIINTSRNLSRQLGYNDESENGT
jgi:DNA-binding IclR family transcriptional regulator